MSKRRRRYPSARIKINEQFVAYPVSLLQSTAFRSLKLAELRILHRLEIEHCRHGGRRNGHLPRTYSDFERHGVRRNSISRAIDKLVQVGLLQITAKGRVAYSDLRLPSRYRLTYLITHDENGAAVPATHEWRRLEKQKARGDLTTGAGSDLTTTKVEKPVAICTPEPGAICIPLSRSRVDGRGRSGEDKPCLTVSPPSEGPSPPLGGMEKSVPPTCSVWSNSEAAITTSRLGIGPRGTCKMRSCGGRASKNLSDFGNILRRKFDRCHGDGAWNGRGQSRVRHYPLLWTRQWPLEV